MISKNHVTVNWHRLIEKWDSEYAGEKQPTDGLTCVFVFCHGKRAVKAEVLLIGDTRFELARLQVIDSGERDLDIFVKRAISKNEEVVIDFIDRYGIPYAMCSVKDDKYGYGVWDVKGLSYKSKVDRPWLVWVKELTWHCSSREILARKAIVDNSREIVKRKKHDSSKT